MATVQFGLVELESDSESDVRAFGVLASEAEIFENMRRCAKCILPDTFLGIEFGENGVCNYCSSYKLVKVHGGAELVKVLDKYRGKGEKYACIVPISGGRDSAFVLHQMVRKCEMRVLALTVDSGAITPERAPAAAVIMALSQPAVSTLFGDKYTSTPLFLALLAVSYLYSAFGSLSTGNLINSQGQTAFNLKLTLLTLAIGFPMGFILISQLGIIGLIITTLTAGIPSLIISLHWLRRHYGVTVD